MEEGGGGPLGGNSQVPPDWPQHLRVDQIMILRKPGGFVGQVSPSGAHCKVFTSSTQLKTVLIVKVAVVCLVYKQLNSTYTYNCTYVSSMDGCVCIPKLPYNGERYACKESLSFGSDMMLKEILGKKPNHMTALMRILMEQAVCPTPAKPCRRFLVKSISQVLDGLGLAVISEQLKDLQLGSLLDTPPPGVDEAIAISKVWDFPVSMHACHLILHVFVNQKPGPCDSSNFESSNTTDTPCPTWFSQPMYLQHDDFCHHLGTSL